MHVLIKQLVERAAWLADGFSWDRLGEDGANDAQIHIWKIERMEAILSEMRTILTENFEVE